VLIILGTLAGMVLFKRDYVQALWTHPLGIKMSIYSSAQASVGGSIFLVACLVLNYPFPPGGADRPGTRRFLSVLLGIMFFVCAVLPPLFVILIGPAAIMIMDEILR
jgi:hypothetical protein